MSPFRRAIPLSKAYTTFVGLVSPAATTVPVAGFDGDGWADGPLLFTKVLLPNSPSWFCRDPAPDSCPPKFKALCCASMPLLVPKPLLLEYGDLEEVGAGEVDG